MLTVRDMVAHIYSHTGNNLSDKMFECAVRTVSESFNNLVRARKWPYLRTLGRVRLYGPYATGTVTYVNATRTLTLSGGVWPSWASRGTVRIGQISHEVETRESDTVLILDPASNPGADIAAPTEYRIYLDAYQLPDDIGSVGVMQLDEYQQVLAYKPIDELMMMRRSISGEQPPICYTFVGDADAIGRKMMRVYPPPNTDMVLSFTYSRIPRPLRVSAYSTGTVTVSGASVSGSGTAFTSAMVGAVLRIGSTTEEPTDVSGRSPYEEEGLIKSVASASSLTLKSPMASAYTSRKFVISSLLDIDEPIMRVALVRGCERDFARLTKEDPAIWGLLNNAYLSALQEAFENANRNHSVVGGPVPVSAMMDWGG